MATTQRAIVDAMVARLRASPALVPKPENRIRVAHRTPVTKEDSPAILIAPVDVEIQSGRADCIQRRVTIEIRIVGRSDGGVASIDALIEETLLRLKPVAGAAIPYPAGAIVSGPKRVRFVEEDADDDLAVASFEVTADYTSDAWSI